MTAGRMSPLMGGRHGSPVLSPTNSLDRPSASLQRMYSMDLPTLSVGPTVVQHTPGKSVPLLFILENMVTLFENSQLTKLNNPSWRQLTNFKVKIHNLSLFFYVPYFWIFAGLSLICEKIFFSFSTMWDRVKGVGERGPRRGGVRKLVG